MNVGTRSTASLALPISAASLHHAYLLIGSREAALRALERFFEDALSVRLHGDPDVVLLSTDLLSVDDSRRLKELMARRPIGPRRLIVCSFDDASREAQNALLKIFEDPPPSAHAFLLASEGANILPTLLSRMFLLRLGADVLEDRERSVAERFLGAPYPERLEIARALAKEVSDEDISRHSVVRIISLIEQSLASMSREKNAGALGSVRSLKRHARSKSSSVKMILEELALDLPSPRN